ncbi:MAG: hypothetical protein HY321_01920 [Armatimonadetes bacterium]|nr:hypothetical protein [Armatimonadota bacterium]
MDFPKEKMEFATTHGDKESDQGWLVLNLGTLDLEGVSRIYINLDLVDDLRKRGERHSDALERMRSLLGGD